MPPASHPALAPVRHALLVQLAELIDAIPTAGVLRVAIDGVDGAGKTTFADDLAARLVALGRRTIRASVDSFHLPREARYRRGRHSPEGFFEDSYDYAALHTKLLGPLGPGGSGRYRRAAFDHRSDAPVLAPEETARQGDVLLLDGIFLHRETLRPVWDFSIFLAVPFEVSVARMATRDGCSPDPAAPENGRYVDGQRIYLARCTPQLRASVVIDYRDWERPVVVSPGGREP